MDTYEKVRRTEGTEGDGNHIGIPTVSDNLDHLLLPETNPPAKKHTQNGLRPSSHVYQRTPLPGLS